MGPSPFPGLVRHLGRMGFAFSRDRRRRRRIFRLADRSGIWPRIGAGCHLSRDTGAAIEAAGFDVERSRRLQFNGLPHILGVARP